VFGDGDGDVNGNGNVNGAFTNRGYLPCCIGADSGTDSKEKGRGWAV